MFALALAILVLGAVSKALGPVTLTGNAVYTFVTDDRDLDVWTLASSIEYRATTTSEWMAPWASVSRATVPTCW